MIEYTVCMIKPDVVRNGSHENIISILQDAGFAIHCKTLFLFDHDDCDKFYSEHVGKDFYELHRDFICSGFCLVLKLERENAVKELRKMLGSYQPLYAAPGTLRKLFGTISPANAVHASDSVEAADKEMDFFWGTK